VKLAAVTLRGAWETLNDCVTEVALYVALFDPVPDGAEAVIVHGPIPVVVPLAVVVPPADATLLSVHGPFAGTETLTRAPTFDFALTENPLPYVRFGNDPKVMVCGFAVEPCGRIMKLPVTVGAALKAVVPAGAVVLLPACDAVMVQLPVLLRVTVAEETPPLPFAIGVTDSLPPMIEHGPDVLKLTCSPFGELLVSAVAVTGTVVVVELESATEFGNGPRAMV
jgi:hypothetical protein